MRKHKLKQLTVTLTFGIASAALYWLLIANADLLVEFANKLQEEQNYDKYAAIKEAAAVRLRPILMTTGAMVFGVVPLLLAVGPGSISRFDIGLVIASGLTIGALFSLYVVPVIYTYVASPRHLANKGT